MSLIDSLAHTHELQVSATTRALEANGIHNIDPMSAMIALGVIGANLLDPSKDEINEALELISSM